MDSKLFKRLKALPSFKNIPRNKIKWLEKNGKQRSFEAGIIADFSAAFQDQKLIM